MKEIPISPTGISMALLLGSSGGAVNDKPHEWIPNNWDFNFALTVWFCQPN